MNVAIVSNFNGIGLQRDAELLAGALAELGHSQHGIQFDEPLPEHCKDFDLAIYLEVIPRNMLGLAPVRFFFGNPEWTKPEIVRTAQRHMHKVFAKTWEAKRIFDQVFPGKTFYTSFLTRDQYDPSVRREKEFLHIGGNSSMRGTQAVLDAWKWKKDGAGIDAKLTIISTALKDRPDLPNVTILDRASEKELRTLQNRCLFHLYPSGTEGWGHAIHESLSVGAVLVTTSAPPMNEIERAMKIPAVKASKYHLADVYEVSALDIYGIATDLMASDLFPETIAGEIRGDNALGRGEFHDNNTRFKDALYQHLAPLDTKTSVTVKEPEAPTFIRKKNTGLQIAFIGNFKAEHSTENQIKWALEEGLGHDVEMLQENEVNLTAIQSAAQFSDLLLWVRTPGWLNVRDHEMLDFLNTTKIPTVSIHLDKFWGIPEREALIGVHPFWRTRYVFTADGSRQDDFASRGVNHFWMRPAVSEVYCHPGQPWDMYRCDVGFVGAREYHKEYPFRGQMVDFLEKTYEGRFKHFTGIRGHALNDVYASCKIVVGDCIFAGTPRYFSDRVPETVGRHGWLLHPIVEELGVPVHLYHPQNLEDLHAMIEFLLQTPAKRRKESILEAVEYVKRWDTWTRRMSEILEIVL
jgi:hypothetical protein